MTIRKTFTASTAVIIGASLLATTNVFACATCGCTLSTDAAMGYTANSGWRFNLEYDYLDQDQLRSGGSSVLPSSVSSINDAGGDQEVENRTINRYTTASLIYASSPSWNFRLLVPYIDRTHSTYGSSNNSLTANDVSGGSLTGLGDIRLIASYQGLLPTHNLGMQIGVKLPTGDYGGPNADDTGVAGRNPKPFTTGPISQSASPDNLIDTSLQPGTGSTDIIVGAYYYQAISQNFDLFLNGQYQVAVQEKLNQPGQDYRPGNTTNLSFGLRYEAYPSVVPQLQINVVRKSHDQGALADVPDTAGTIAYLSPGVTAAIMKNTQVYGFVQIPVYSKLDGYQLFPRWTASVGLSVAF